MYKIILNYFYPLCPFFYFTAIILYLVKLKLNEVFKIPGILAQYKQQPGNERKISIWKLSNDKTGQFRLSISIY